MRLLRLTLILLAIGLVCVAAALLYARHDYFAPGPSEQATTLVIPAATPFARIAAMLEENRLIRHRQTFTAMAIWRGERGRFKAGEYRFLPGTPPAEIARRMIAGDVVVHAVTIPEGLISADIAAILNRTPALSGPVDPKAIPEGSLLPESYQFLRDTPRATLVARMKQAMSKRLAAEWNARDSGLPLASPEEAVILASIVEKETGLAGERPHIAAVFLNRLRLRMPLQSDPTTLYGLYRETGVRSLVLSRAQLAHPTTWNTYVIPALPPSPICHPGAAALHAVMHPAPSSDLYFVADGTGGHRFAATLDAHAKNVAYYRGLPPALPR